MPPCAGMIQIRFDGRNFDQFPLSPVYRTPVFKHECSPPYAGAMSATSLVEETTKSSSRNPANLRLRDRPIDIVFVVVFSWMIISCFISDLLPTIGVDF